MPKQRTKFFEFTLINQSMRDDYREKIVRGVLLKRESLSKTTRNHLNESITEWISVPGFRKGHIQNVGMGLKMNF